MEMDLKEIVKNVLFEEKENGFLKKKPEQKEMLTNCYVYETVEGEIDSRFEPRSQGLSIILIGCLRTKIRK